MMQDVVWYYSPLLTELLNLIDMVNRAIVHDKDAVGCWIWIHKGEKVSEVFKELFPVEGPHSDITV